MTFLVRVKENLEDPDRLLPTGKKQRNLARELYERVRDLPITLDKLLR